MPAPREANATVPAATVSSTTPLSRPSVEAAVLRAARVAALPHHPLALEVDQHDVRRLLRRDPRDRQPVQRTAGGDPLDHQRSGSTPGLTSSV